MTHYSPSPSPYTHTKQALHNCFHRLSSAAACDKKADLQELMACPLKMRLMLMKLIKMSWLVRGAESWEVRTCWAQDPDSSANIMMHLFFLHTSSELCHLFTSSHVHSLVEVDPTVYVWRQIIHCPVTMNCPSCTTGQPGAVSVVTNNTELEENPIRATHHCSCSYQSLTDQRALQISGEILREREQSRLQIDYTPDTRRQRHIRFLMFLFFLPLFESQAESQQEDIKEVFSDCLCSNCCHKFNKMFVSASKRGEEWPSGPRQKWYSLEK